MRRWEVLMSRVISAETLVAAVLNNKGPQSLLESSVANLETAHRELRSHGASR